MRNAEFGQRLSSEAIIRGPHSIIESVIEQ